MSSIPATASPARRTVARPRPWAVDALAAAGGIGLGASIALAFSGQSTQALSGPAGQLTFAGRLTGMVGAYLMLVVVLLAGRLAVVERTLGQDRLLRWHRRLAPWSLVLIVAHVVLTVAGYAQQARTGLSAQAWILIAGAPGMLMAAAATGLLLLAGVTSCRRARRRLSHETWWAIHLYTYLALALSLSHQLTSGAAFATTSWARAFWLTLWLGTAGVVLGYRAVLPLVRSVRHDLRVVAVRKEGPGVISLTLRGRMLHRLPVAGGQFLNWRFLRRGLWWQAHPYSLSALPDGRHLRITVKDLGDHSAGLAAMPVGTRVAFEGPYGTFTADHAQQPHRVLAVGAGVGITPIRTLLEDLPDTSRPVVILRAREDAGLVHVDEIEELVAERGGQVHRLVGPRDVHPLDSITLRRLVPDVADRDLYVCGPPGLTSEARRAALRCGIPDVRIHHETFTP